MTKDDARRAVSAIAWSRVAFGVAAMAAPVTAARLWTGEDDRGPLTRVMVRSLGARDVALGLGAVLALRHDAPVRGWVEGGGLADAADTVGTLLAFRALPRARRWLVLATSAAAMASARILSTSVD
ncbi:MAG TPA: hypothetical protein VFC33_00030 [Acidimicrobiia bacterium]|nr:hypothetical protein [Acidimicrobiia bacterium]